MSKINRHVSKVDNITVEVCGKMTIIQPSGSYLYFKNKKDFNDFVREVKRLHKEQDNDRA